jgi:hypothetical protein
VEIPRGPAPEPPPDAPPKKLSLQLRSSRILRLPKSLEDVHPDMSCFGSFPAPPD